MRRLAIVVMLLASIGNVWAQADDVKVPSAVREVQDALKTLGYLAAASDGQWSESTRRAAGLFLADVEVPDRQAFGGADLPLLRSLLEQRLTETDPTRPRLLVGTLGKGYGDRVHISDDGRTVVRDSQSLVTVWDTASRTQVSQPVKGCCGGTSVLSADGRVLVTARSQGRVRIHDLTTGRLRGAFDHQVDNYQQEVTALSLFRGDGALLFGDGKGIVYLHDLSTRRTVTIGQHFAKGVDTSFRGRVLAIAVDTAGERAASITSADGALKIWDIAGRRLLRSVPLYKPHPENGSSEGSLPTDAGKALIAFAPNGRSVSVLDLEKGGAVRTVDLTTGAITQDGQLKGPIVASRDGRLVAPAGSYRSIKTDILEFPSLKPVRSLHGVSKLLAIDVTGNLAAGDSEQFGRTVFSLADGTKETVTAFLSPADPVAVANVLTGPTPDRLWVGRAGSSLVAFDLSTGEIGFRALNRTSFDFDRAVALRGIGLVDISDIWVEGSKSATIRRLDPVTGVQTPQAVVLSRPLGTGETRANMSYAAESGLMAAAIAGGSSPFVSLLDPTTATEKRRIPLKARSSDALGLSDFCTSNCKRSVTSGDPFGMMFGKAAAIELSGSGKTLFAGYWEPFFTAYDTASGRELQTFDTRLPFKMFNPGAKIAARAGADGWDVPTSERVARANSVPKALISVPGREEVWAILGAPTFFIAQRNYMLHFTTASPKPERIVEVPAFSGPAAVPSDLSRIAMVVSGSYGVSVELPSGRQLAEFRSAGAEIKSLKFSEDGKRLVGGLEDGGMAVWDAATGALLTTSFIFADGQWLTLTAEGFFAASDGAAALVTAVRGREPITVDRFYQSLYRPDLVREKLAGDPEGNVRRAAQTISLDAVLASGAPPSVAFVDPPATTDADTVRVEVDLVDRGGGIGKLEWRVGGVTVGLGGRGLGRSDQERAPSAGRTIRVSQVLPLSPGENTIEAVVYNAKDLVASSPVRATITSTAAAIAGPGRLQVLAIGVNDYFDSRLALRYAVPDVRAVAGAFNKARGTLFSAVDVTVLTDQDVTAEKIEETFAAVGARTRPQDTFILFVAGHGKTVDGRYYFLPRNFRYRDEGSIARDGIGQNQFQEWLSRIRAQRSVLLFDTCESGSLTGDRIGERGLARAVAMEKMTQAMGRTTIAAATDDAPALEGYRGHGIFTYALLQGIQSADQDGNSVVDVLEMIKHLDSSVPALSDKAFGQRQIPQARFAGSNFAIAAVTAVVDDAAPTATGPIPSRPTHVVVAPADLRDGPDGAVRETLSPGSLLAVVKTADGWALVARDGREIGYLREGQLIPTR